MGKTGGNDPVWVRLGLWYEGRLLDRPVTIPRLIVRGLCTVMALLSTAWALMSGPDRALWPGTLFMLIFAALYSSMLGRAGADFRNRKSEKETIHVTDEDLARETA
jgi:hypothetical protein